MSAVKFFLRQEILWLWKSKFKIYVQLKNDDKGTNRAIYYWKMTDDLETLRKKRNYQNKLIELTKNQKGIDLMQKVIEETRAINEELLNCQSVVKCEQAARKKCAEKQAAYLKQVAGAGHKHTLDKSLVNKLCISK